MVSFHDMVGFFMGLPYGTFIWLASIWDFHMVGFYMGLPYGTSFQLVDLFSLEGPHLPITKLKVGFHMGLPYDGLPKGGFDEPFIL